MSAFAMMDRNNDGVVTRQEFQNAMMGAPQQQPAYGIPQQQAAYGAPQQQVAFGAPQQQVAYGAPQQQIAYGAPQQQVAFGAAQQITTYGAPQPQVTYGAPQNMPAPAAPSAFNMMDRNGDGVVTRQEFAQATAAPQISYGAPAQAAFAPATISYGTGMPQAAPAPAPISYGMGMPQAQVSYTSAPAALPAFNMMDRNGDGVVTRQEFVQATAAPQISYGAPVQAAYAPATISYGMGMPQAAPAPATISYGMGMPQAAPQVTYGAPAPVQYAQPAPIQYAASPMQMNYGSPQPQPAAAFNAMDLNHDGVVTRQEFAQALTTTYANPPQMYAPPQVSYEPPPQVTYSAPAPVQYAQPAQIQYAAPPVQMNYGSPQPQPAAAFNAMDRNHDGVVTRQEFAQAQALTALTTTYATPPQVYAAPQAAPAQIAYAAPAPVYAQPQQQQYAAPVAPVYAQQQQMTYAAPAQQMSYEPQMYAAPAQQMSYEPQMYAAPAQQMSYEPQMNAAPAQQVSYQSQMAYGAPMAAQPQQVQYMQQGQGGVFDMMDRNHDGVVTRNEFAQMMR